MEVSPRQRFRLRFVTEYCPWFGETFSFGEDVKVSCCQGHDWCELFYQLRGQRGWSFLGVFPQAWYRILTKSEKVEWIMGFLDKLPSEDAKSGQVVAMADKSFLKDYPAVSEFCWANCWPTGEVRMPSSLTFFAEDGQWKVCLSERNKGLSLWGSGPTFEIALQCLEDRLQSDHPDWRKAKRQRGK